MGLICQECAYDNDPTRVYCHNCGKRLERGGEAPPPPTGFTHPTDVLKMKQPRRRLALGAYLSALLKLLVIGGLGTALVLALLEPEDVPAPVAEDASKAARLSDLLTDSSTAGDTRAFGVPAEDVNQWLVSTVRFEPPESSMQLRPERVYAVPGDGVVRVGLVAGLPWWGRIYFEADYAPEQDGKGYTVRPRRLSIGRLPVPVLAGWPVERQFGGLADALAGPLEQLSRASAIGITPETVTLRWSNSAP